MLKVLTIFGTRPEAIKLAPVLIEMRKYPYIKSYVCVTAQHRQMLDQMLKIFDIVPDIDLNLMQENQSLAELTARVIASIDKVLVEVSPDIVLIQGDTTTVMATALAAFYRKIRIGHVEAGLRTETIYSPFPEEMNRRVTSIVSNYHFAPTNTARDVLLREGVSADKIFMTGNPVIDALNMIVKRPHSESVRTLLDKMELASDTIPIKKMILVTAHRRENYGEKIENICRGIRTLADNNKNLSIIYPVHYNPNIRNVVMGALGGHDRILLCDPVEYDSMAHLMNASHMILTDSGGVQEEAPALGKPVLVMRTETERPEGIEAGTAKLVGPFADRIVEEAQILLDNEEAYNKMAFANNPYGDGKAGSRIAEIISSINI